MEEHWKEDGFEFLRDDKLGAFLDSIRVNHDRPNDDTLTIGVKDMVYRIDCSGLRKRIIEILTPLGHQEIMLCKNQIEKKIEGVDSQKEFESSFLFQYILRLIEMEFHV
ncbi:MAG: hypothetical protein HY453_00475 [Parcubacteria group bacterium]|nr:hypothetical protein [Parcubacteria group bacterium]